MNDDVGVVDEYPSTVTFTLTSYRLRADLAQPVLDGVDDRLDLSVVRRRADHERVGDHELIGDVERDNVLGELVGGGLRSGVHEFDGAVCGCHVCPSFGS